MARRSAVKLSTGDDSSLDNLLGAIGTDMAKGLAEELSKRPEADLYEEGKALLEEELGIVIMPDATATRTCLLQFYTRAQPFEVPGINVPKTFAYCQPLNAAAYNALNRKWRLVLGNMPADIAEFWLPVLIAKPRQMPEIEAYVARLLALEASYASQYETLAGFSQGIAFHPDNAIAKGLIPRAFVPEAGWFDERFDGLSEEQILTLMPEAERNLFMLFLGRTLCGRDNSLPIGEDEKLTHKFRKMCIIYGKDARTGKSTLANAIISTMRSCGYLVSTFRKIGEKFNMGNIYSADLAFKDDTNLATADAILNSDDTKTLITGGQMWTEDKGRDGFGIYPNCTVLFCTNDLNQDVLYGKDAGIIDRLAVLYTRSHVELANMAKPIGSEDSPDMRSHEQLAWLANKHRTTVEGIMLWLFRRAIDTFLEHLAADQLEKRISWLTTHLHFPLSNQALPNVVMAMHLALLLRTPAEHMEDYCLLPLTNKATLLHIANAYAWLQGDPRGHNARSLLKDHWDLLDRPILHPWLAIRSISPTSLINMLDSLQSIANNTSVSLDDAIKQCFSQLSTINGISIGSGKTFVKRAWDECTATALRNMLIGMAKQIQSKLLADMPTMSKANASMLSREPANLQFTNYVGYDPDKMARILHKLYVQAKMADEVVDYIAGTKAELEKFTLKP